MLYQRIEELTRPEIEAALLRDNPNELSLVVLSVALYGAAFWAEDICLHLATHKQENVRGNAVLGFGHIARIHRQLSRDKVKPLLESAFQDKSAFVRAQAEAARNDVEVFLGWRFEKP